ncbi:MAG: hypothetical protein K5872_06080 [Rhizobiaceae bacterium]|nr:hypothetical protein [Rhizobiaceae bacterium]MCV0405781.1 hypothetical protein [Rhizobiaceae bacterium]
MKLATAGRVLGRLIAEAIRPDHLDCDCHPRLGARFEDAAPSRFKAEPVEEDRESAAPSERRR